MPAQTYAEVKSDPVTSNSSLLTQTWLAIYWGSTVYGSHPPPSCYSGSDSTSSLSSSSVVAYSGEFGVWVTWYWFILEAGNVACS